jgi:hypothetical protein
MEGSARWKPRGAASRPNPKWIACGKIVIPPGGIKLGREHRGASEKGFIFSIE